MIVRRALLRRYDAPSLNDRSREPTLYRGLSVLAFAPVLDEEKKIGDVVRRVPRDVVDTVLVVDDGSTDRSREVAAEGGAEVLELGRTIGVGAAIRAGYELGVERGFDVVVVMAGNNKDAPEEIPLLLDPIADDRADVVQGSRWLKGQENFGPMPAYRKVATKAHPMLFSAIARQRFTDTTNGFRAVRTSVLIDPRIDLRQDWLDEYELEPYLLMKAVKVGHRVTEVPVTKIYPAKALGQTKMKPIVGWWSILRPLVLMGLGVKK